MISVVGIGPGAERTLTPEARQILGEADRILGYERYLDQIRIMSLPDPPKFQPYELGEEQRRARDALDLHRQNETVALVSSGDAGIYGIAAALFEELPDEFPPEAIRVVPGVSSLQAAAARLGCPVGQDFAAVSLSDLLTPWETIEQRLEHAARGDFVVLLFNPQSNQRTWQLPEALEILSEHRSEPTPVGLVRNLYRPGEERILTTLDRFNHERADMDSLVVVGNSSSYIRNNWMITPRGYR